MLHELINKKPNNEERPSWQFTELNVSDLDMIHHYYYRNKYDFVNEGNEQLYLMDAFTTELKNC